MSNTMRSMFFNLEQAFGRPFNEDVEHLYSQRQQRDRMQKEWTDKMLEQMARMRGEIMDFFPWEVIHAHYPPRLTRTNYPYPLKPTILKEIFYLLRKRRRQ